MNDKLYNMTSYLRSNLRTFEEEPVNARDALVFSWISYLGFPEQLKARANNGGCELRELFRTEYFEYMFKSVLFPEETLVLLSFAAASPRFRHVIVRDYEDRFEVENEEQFAAMSFEIEPKLKLLAFRGTDRTVIGWKEDFNMALADAVPSQSSSVAYLERVAHRDGADMQYLLAGHSKGGNLAVYAAVCCDPEVQEQIRKAISFDGPGFSEEFLKSSGFARVEKKLDKYLPQSSMIGMIFEPECEYHIVHSNEIGIMQHNPFSWEMTPEDFCYMDSLRTDSRIVYRSLNRWVNEMDGEERKTLIESLFGLLEATGVHDFNEFGENLPKNMRIIGRELKQMRPEQRKFLLEIFAELASENLKTLQEMAADSIKHVQIT